MRWRRYVRIPFMVRCDFREMRLSVIEYLPHKLEFRSDDSKLREYIDKMNFVV